MVLLLQSTKPYCKIPDFIVNLSFEELIIEFTPFSPLLLIREMIKDQNIGI
jgi:hypothetical protein